MKVVERGPYDITHVATLESTGKSYEIAFPDLLSPGDPGQIYYGFDGELTGEENLTKEEKLEIADYMIERWRKWKESLQ